MGGKNKGRKNKRKQGTNKVTDYRFCWQPPCCHLFRMKELCHSQLILQRIGCDSLASQADKLSAVEVVGVRSMHGLTCQRMSRMSVNVNVVSMIRVLGSGILVTV